MSPLAKKWVVALEAEFGVGPEFSSHLLPVLEWFSAQDPSAEECERVFKGVAAAYRSRQEVQADSVEEVELLLSQFVSELNKLDETLKVLGAYLERVRTRVRQPTPRRMIH